ncbi:SpoIIE family protein phosphatase [bacterium]|nr:SpoIIE family protein phosphatase [bacterium]
MRPRIFFILLLAIVFSACQYPSMDLKPVAINGVLDLRNWNFDSSGIVDLDGEWEIYWNQLIENSDISQGNAGKEKISIPSSWTNSSEGYATFHLKVLMGKSAVPLALKIPHMATAYRFYLNGRLISSNGVVGISQSLSVPFYQPRVYDFDLNSDQLDMVIQISNYHYYKGGLWKSIKLGSERNIRRQEAKKIAFDLLLFGAILIMGIYHIAMFFFRKTEKAPLYFGLFCFLISFRILVTDEIYISHLLPGFPWFILVKVEYLTYYLTIPTFTFYMVTLFPKEFIRWTFQAIQFVGLTFSIIVLVTPARVFSSTVQIYQVFTVACGLYAVYLLIMSILKKRRGIVFFLLGFVAMLITVINDILFANNIIQTAFLLQLGFFIFILFQALLLTSRASYSFSKVEKLTEELEENNLMLEQRVVERTEELREANRELYRSLNEVKSANQKIMSSISYAKRIQNSLLPNTDYMKLFISDYLLIWRPRDIVGGDIYFANEFQDGFLVAVIDCTGHGVPGAFMTMLASSNLRRITMDEGCLEPAEILKRLNRIVKKSLQQDADYATSDDGMDASICFVNLKDKTLTFSGSRQSLVYTANGEVNTIKGDRESIGYKKSNPEYCFKNNVIPIEKGMSFYLFTDGYIDQLGGDNRTSLGNKRFQRLLKEHSHQPFEQQEQNIINAFNRYRGENEIQDDITIFGFSIN